VIASFSSLSDICNPIPHNAPLVNLATLHFRLFPEDTFHTGAQRIRSISHHQISPLQIQSAAHGFVGISSTITVFSS
jgi:hypothetical protein